jgi:DNA gyrase subunit A
MPDFPERPDLSQLDPKILAYIQSLETELRKFRSQTSRNLQERRIKTGDDILSVDAIPGEPPTTIQIITFTANFLAKRTSRHLYDRQHRGGMGVFDLDSSDDDPPVGLASADETQSILLFTNLGRVFRLPVTQLTSTEVRAHGVSLAERLILQPEEHLVTILPDYARGAVALVSQRGYVRYLRHHIFGEYMKPGVVLMESRQFGPLVAACRTPGDADLFIATRQGKAIRFSEKLIPPQGGLGIRLESDDIPVAITSATDESAIFLIDSLGNGTIRMMSAFTANKSAGGGGKIAMKTDSLVTACTVESSDDLFVISDISKIIRFPSSEVPPKEGVVQGVHCMTLRREQVIVALASHLEV